MSERKSKNFKKRPPPKSFTRVNDIYITNKTDFVAQQKKCIELLNSEAGEVFLHAIGNAINRAINLALKLEEEYLFKYECNTSTISLTGTLNWWNFLKYSIRIYFVPLQTIIIH